jgi:hypothetical protein
MPMPSDPTTHQSRTLNRRAFQLKKKKAATAPTCRIARKKKMTGFIG